MRLNKEGKKGNGWSTAGSEGRAKPKFISPGVTIGRVSGDPITMDLAPSIQELAAESLERYADELMTYEDLVKEFDESTREIEVEADGSVRPTMEPPVPPAKPLFRSQFIVDEFKIAMEDTAKHFSDKGGWKVHVNAAKFERNLDEKYGIFRPFITNHPEVEVFIRSVQRKYAMGYFSPLRQGPPPVPRSTSIILLFMMQRQGVGWKYLILASLFLLIGLQPWALVAIVALFHHLVNKRKKKPLRTMKSSIKPVKPYWRVHQSGVASDNEKKSKYDVLLKPVGTPLDSTEQIDGSNYDTIILGSGPGTLYAGALLSRAGRKVLVLCPRNDASGCLVLGESENKTISDNFKNVPFDIEATNVSRVGRQQELLVPALCTASDFQGGIRFAQIGSDADGYVFEILSIPGMGADGDGQIPFVLRAAGGHRTLMDDAATLLGDGWPGMGDELGDSSSGMYLAACTSINASAGVFYLSKVLKENTKGFQGSSNYEESATRYASAFLNKCFPLNAHLRSLMAGIGMKGENLRPNSTSMGAHVTNICAAMSGEGVHYPVGGPRALCHALASVIEQSGGRVATNVNVAELIFDKTPVQNVAANTNGGEVQPINVLPPRCTGVKLVDKREIMLPSQPGSGDDGGAVISMNGFIDTFVRLFPEDVRDAHKVPMGLPALSERRPVFKFLFALNGSADELNITGADYYRLPGAALARDEVDPETGVVALGEIGWSDDKPTEANDHHDEVEAEQVNNQTTESDQTEAVGSVRGKRSKLSSTKRPGKFKFDAGISWLQVSFPSAKDPSWEERHGKVTTCVVTIEADDDFVVPFDSKPKLYSIVKAKVEDVGNRSRLMERVKRDLYEIFPQLEGAIEYEEMRGPFTKGLSHNPERYAAKGIRADTPYPGLFMGGSDLTVGESFSGSIVGSWLVANAVMGYGPLDLLFLEKNITSDLERFLGPPSLIDDAEAQLAVPYTPKAIAPEPGDGDDDDDDFVDETQGLIQ